MVSAALSIGKVPLAIDPQQQAKKWIKEKEKDNSLKVVSLQTHKLQNILASCVRLGQPLLVSNTESLPYEALTLSRRMTGILTGPEFKEFAGGGGRDEELSSVAHLSECLVNRTCKSLEITRLILCYKKQILTSKRPLFFAG